MACEQAREWFEETAPIGLVVWDQSSKKCVESWQSGKQRVPLGLSKRDATSKVSFSDDYHIVTKEGRLGNSFITMAWQVEANFELNSDSSNGMNGNGKSQQRKALLKGAVQFVSQSLRSIRSVLREDADNSGHTLKYSKILGALVSLFRHIHLYLSVRVCMTLY